MNNDTQHEASKTSETGRKKEEKDLKSSEMISHVIRKGWGLVLCGLPPIMMPRCQRKASLKCIFEKMCSWDEQ